MPLLSTRASASATGYGNNLGSTNGFSAYGYTPYLPAGGTSATGLVYDSIVSASGTSYFVVTRVYTGTTFEWSVSTYSRNISTGVLTYVSTTFVVSASISSTVHVNTSPDGLNLYLSFTNNTTSTTEASNFIYQYSIDPTTKNITPLSPAYANVGTGAGAYWTSCSTDGKFLYVGSSSINKIYIFSRNTSTGVLSLSNIYNTPANTLPYCPRVTGDNANLYASSNGTDASKAILQYSRNIVTGDLVPLSPEGVAGSQQMRYLNFNPDFVGIHCNSAYNSTTYIYGRDPFTGLLVSTATQGGTLYRVTYSSDGYVMLGTNGLNSGKLMTTQTTFQGAIDPGYGTVTPYNNPNFFALQTTNLYLDPSPNYDYYYAASSSSGYIAQFTFDGTYLRQVNGPTPNGSAVNVNYETTTGNQAPSSLVVSPDGKSLYASGYWTGASGSTTKFGTQFNLAASTGIPTRSTSTSYGTNQGNGAICISANSSFLYQVDDFVNPPVIRQYSRNTSTGDLTALGTPTITIPCPNAGGGTFQRNFIGTPFLSVDQKNLYVFVSSGQYGVDAIPKIVQYTRDTATGLLTFLGSTNIGSFATTVGGSVLPATAILPTDNFVYVSGVYSGTDFGVDILSRNTTTGALTYSTQVPISGSPYYGMLISPDGANLYNGSGYSIDIYSINSSTGALTFSKTQAVDIRGYLLAMKPNGTGIILGTIPVSGNAGLIKLIKRNTTSGDLFGLSTVFRFYNPQFQYTYNAGYTLNYAVAISPDSSKFYVVGASLQFGTLS